MKTLFLLLMLTPIMVGAQSNKPVDSVTYYQTQLGKLWRQNSDSFRKSEGFVTVRNKIEEGIRKRNDYTGAVLFADIAHSDYKAFNSILAQSGFAPLHPLSLRFGIGIAHKRGNTMYDMYFGTVGLGNGTTSNNRTIRTSFSNLLQIDIGFDVLNKERISLYPYGGLSFRSSLIKYDSSGQPNPNYTSLLNMMTNSNSVRLESDKGGYQYGTGFDYAVAYNKQKTFKLILFIKGGVNKPFKTDTYKTAGIPDYKPGIKQGDWLMSIGIKFGNKR